MTSHKKLTIGKKLGIAFGTIFGVVLILLIAGYFLVGDYFYDLALNTKNTIFMDSINEHFSSDSPDVQMPLRDDEWLDQYKDKETVTIVSTDKEKLKLSAIKVMRPSATNKWVVTVHGYRGENKEMSAYAREFNKMGYNVLMPSLRGHGESEGDYIGMGWDDRLDIVAWIQQIITWDPDAEIVLHGVSMGAATVCMTIGEQLPDNVIAAISDCAYTSAYDEFKSVLISNNIPTFPVLQAAGTMAGIKAGYGLAEASAKKQVAHSTTPTLFIHGDKDSFVPYSMMDELFAASTAERKSCYTVPGAAHAMGMTKNPTLYFEKIKEFLG